MNWLTSLFSSASATPIEAVGNVLDKLFTSDEEKEHAKIVLTKLAQHPGELQAEINKVEAAHRSIFVAGWRPFIGWICGLSLGCYFVPQYLVSAYVWGKMVLAMTDFSGGLPPFPATVDGLTQLVFALLGLGTLRTTEKFGGRTK